MIVNVHERQLAASAEQVGALLDRLFTGDDRLWPAERWPMRRRGELRVGAACHHDDVRYTVAEYKPGRHVWFAFTDINLHGGHGFDISGTDGATRLRHTLSGGPRRSMRILWPLVVRPIHDALVEDLLDNAERELTGTVASPHRYSRWVRLLRATIAHRGPASATSGAAGDPSLVGAQG